MVGGVVEAGGRVERGRKEAGQGGTWVSVGMFVQDNVLCRVKRLQ